MKFRTKLFYSLIVLGLTSTLLSLFITYRGASRLIFEEIRTKIFSLVIDSGQRISTESLAAYIRSRGETDSAEFERLSDELQEIGNLNRRSDIYVESVYLIKKYDDSNRYYFLLDIQPESREGRVRYGLPYPSKVAVPSDVRKAFVTPRIYSDERGTWLSGYAPIYDHEGNTIALLGVDVRTEEVYLELEKLFLYILVAFAVSIVVAIIFAHCLSKIVSSSLGILCDMVKGIGKGNFSKLSHLDTRDEFNELSLAIHKMAKGLEERKRLKLGFARYVSQYALEELLKTDQPISLVGERKKVTLLFSDIRHFTKLAEQLPPEEVLTLLNEYFTEMIEVIFNHGGTLDKFIGDGIMVGFGAPLEDKLQELHAVLAAVQMQLHLDRLCDHWEKEGRQRIRMGIGIHTGLAVIGTIGSELRMEYTAIGDTVNVAFRLERFTKKLEKSVIVSEAVYEKVKDYFVFEDLKEIEIPGRKGMIRAYSLDPYGQKNLPPRGIPSAG
ncbi:MAG: adenylate/guanylate cyclase domain-containing protein [Chlamydiota bacterium]